MWSKNKAKTCIQHIERLKGFNQYEQTFLARGNNGLTQVHGFIIDLLFIGQVADDTSDFSDDLIPII